MWRINTLISANNNNLIFMNKILLILILLFYQPIFAQDKVNNLNRFFIDIAPTFAMYKPIEDKITQTFGGVIITYNSPDFGGGLEFKTGNNFYLKKGKFCGVIQLTWFRLGFIFSDGLLPFASPLNIGIGHHFQLNNQISIVPSLHSGIMYIVDDILGGNGFIDHFIMPEVKLNIGNFALGVEYSIKRDYSNKNGKIDGHYHYLGLSFGSRIGNI